MDGYVLGETIALVALLLVAIAGWDKWARVNRACIEAEREIRLLTGNVEHFKQRADHWKGVAKEAMECGRAEVSTLKDELEECKLAKLRVEKTCDILEEQAIRFSKSNAELGTKVVELQERIEDLLASLRVIHVKSMEVMVADAKQYPDDEPACVDFDDPANDVSSDSVSLD